MFPFCLFLYHVSFLLFFLLFLFKAVQRKRNHKSIITNPCTAGWSFTNHILQTVSKLFNVTPICNMSGIITGISCVPLGRDRYFLGERRDALGWPVLVLSLCMCVCSQCVPSRSYLSALLSMLPTGTTCLLHSYWLFTFCLPYLNGKRNFSAAYLEVTKEHVIYEFIWTSIKIEMQ